MIRMSIEMRDTNTSNGLEYLIKRSRQYKNTKLQGLMKDLEYSVEGASKQRTHYHIELSIPRSPSNNRAVDEWVKKVNQQFNNTMYELLDMRTINRICAVNSRSIIAGKERIVELVKQGWLIRVPGHSRGMYGDIHQVCELMEANKITPEEVIILMPQLDSPDYKIYNLPESFHLISSESVKTAIFHTWLCVLGLGFEYSPNDRITHNACKVLAYYEGDQPRGDIILGIEAAKRLGIPIENLAGRR